MFATFEEKQYGSFITGQRKVKHVTKIDMSKINGVITKKNGLTNKKKNISWCCDCKQRKNKYYEHGLKT